MEFRTNAGQAVVEYLILLSAVAFAGFTLVKGISTFISSSSSNLGYQLTQELSVGVCESDCFGDGYENRKK